MAFIIFDLEFNQPYLKYRDSRLLFEILEIGAVKFDDKFNIIDTFRVYVKNQVYKDVNPVVRRLTNMTKDDLQYGLEFPKAYQIFTEWVNDSVVFHWSVEDMSVWKSNCDYYRLNKTKIKFVDIQHTIMIMMNFKKAPSLESICKKFNVDSKGTHNGLDDSYNTLKVFKSISESEHLNEYIQSWYKYQKDIKNRIETLINYDKRKFTTYCKKCKKSITREIMYCDEHGLHILGVCEVCGANLKFSYNIENSKIKKKVKSYKPRDYKAIKHINIYNYKNTPYHRNYHYKNSYKPNIEIKEIPNTFSKMLEIIQPIEV